MAELKDFKVQTPGGVTTVRAPVGSTDEQLMSFAKQEYEKTLPPKPAVPPQEQDYSKMDVMEQLLTAAGNVPASAVQAAKDITAPIHSPVQTAKALYGLGAGAVQLAIPGEQGSEDNARQAWEFMKKRYGGWDNIQNTFVKDPVGFLSDAAGIFSGGGTIAAKLPGKAGQWAKKTADIANAVDPATAAARATGRVLSPRTNPMLKQLMDAGVKPTIGQVLGGPIGKFEEKMTGVPIVGDVIAGGRQRAAGQLTKAAFNRVLNPLGKTANKLEINRQGLQKVKAELTSAYDTLLDDVAFSVDDIFMDDVSKIVDEASTVLTVEERIKLNNIVASKVFGRLAGEADSITGVPLKKTMSDLRGQASKQRRGGPGDLEISEALDSIHDAVTQALIRANPTQATQLKAIDTGYANYARLRKAFTSGGVKADGLTPASLDAAVRASDKSVGKGDSATGTALMQDLSEPGVTILGSKVPDSGTAGRAAAMGIPAVLAGFGQIEPSTLTAALLSAAPYLPGAQSVFADMLTKRTPFAQQAGAKIQQYGPTISRAAHQGGRYGERKNDYLLNTGRK